jgi:hypothetical protein
VKSSYKSGPIAERDEKLQSGGEETLNDQCMIPALESAVKLI